MDRSQRGFVVVALLIIVALVLGGAYLYTQQEETQEPIRQSEEVVQEEGAHLIDCNPLGGYEDAMLGIECDPLSSVDAERERSAVEIVKNSGITYASTQEPYLMISDSRYAGVFVQEKEPNSGPNSKVFPMFVIVDLKSKTVTDSIRDKWQFTGFSDRMFMERYALADDGYPTKESQWMYVFGTPKAVMLKGSDLPLTETYHKYRVDEYYRFTDMVATSSNSITFSIYDRNNLDEECRLVGIGVPRSGCQLKKIEDRTFSF